MKHALGRTPFGIPGEMTILRTYRLEKSIYKALHR